MKDQRICKACSAIESSGVKFPKYGLLCVTCYNAAQRKRHHDNKERENERSAEYYDKHKSDVSATRAKYYQKNRVRINDQDREEYAEKVKDKPPRPCIDCGAPMPKRARLYCEQCRIKHNNESVRKAMKRYRKKE